MGREVGDISDLSQLDVPLRLAPFLCLPLFHYPRRHLYSNYPWVQLKVYPAFPPSFSLDPFIGRSFPGHYSPFAISEWYMKWRESGPIAPSEKTDRGSVNGERRRRREGREV